MCERVAIEFALLHYLSDAIQDFRRTVPHSQCDCTIQRRDRLGLAAAGAYAATERPSAPAEWPQHTAKLNGHDPYRYLKNVLERLPTQPASRLEELLPHRC
jgi:hypothetical protein